MEVFDDLERHIQNPLVLQSILSLMERGTMVLTTNYDNLLEIFGQQQSKPMESLDLKDKTKVRGGAGRPRAEARRQGVLCVAMAVHVKSVPAVFPYCPTVSVSPSRSRLKKCGFRWNFIMRRGYHCCEHFATVINSAKCKFLPFLKVPRKMLGSKGMTVLKTDDINYPSILQKGSPLTHHSCGRVTHLPYLASPWRC